MGKFIDLTGQKFGRLIVIQRLENDINDNLRWLCECDCEEGERIIAQGGDLKRGHTKSCGCLRKEITKKIGKSNIKHGYYKNNQSDRIYIIWNNMIQRCAGLNCKNYRNYSSRRIIVCQRWLKFKNFLKDIGEAPEGLQIDRINNNKGYFKDNCRWATREQQQRNTRRNHLITAFDKTQTMIEWSEEMNIGYDVIRFRLKRGWSIEKALTTPVGKRKK